MDRHARTFDLARNYPQTGEACARGLQVIREFEADHGLDKVWSLPAAIPDGPAWANTPICYAWPSDRTIYYLSLSAGQDLFPWFAERGLSIHRLPIVKRDAEDLKAQMVTRAREALRAPDEALSSRMDAADDLVNIVKPDDNLPADADDDWTALCDALRLADQSDARAPAALTALFAPGKPADLRALAGAALADLGDASVADDLIPLARRFDPRFQLSAGYALAKAGSPRAGELSLEAIIDASSKRVGRLDVEYDGVLTMHAEVEGYRVCNVLSDMWLSPFTADAALSLHYVAWVHTAEIWRRRGLSRYTVERTMRHPAAMKCSCSELGTGTRNLAHPLYRDQGFTDLSVTQFWQRELPGSAPSQPPTGVILRPYAPDDAAKVRDLWRECRGKHHKFHSEPRGMGSPTAFAFVAESAGDILGFASADQDGSDDAWLNDLVVKQHDQRDRIADGLLALVHRGAFDAKLKMIKRYDAPEDDVMRAALNRAGYVATRAGGVGMMQVRHLDQFLREIAPTIEKRLADSDLKGWTGTIDLLGSRLQGRVTVKANSPSATKARVTAGKPTATPADITLTCDDDTATRVAIGRETPFEAYLQTRLTIHPRISDGITRLLETIFPKVPLT